MLCVAYMFWSLLMKMFVDRLTLIKSKEKTAPPVPPWVFRYIACVILLVFFFFASVATISKKTFHLHFKTLPLCASLFFVIAGLKLVDHIEAGYGTAGSIILLVCGLRQLIPVGNDYASIERGSISVAIALIGFQLFMGISQSNLLMQNGKKDQVEPFPLPSQLPPPANPTRFSHTGQIDSLSQPLALKKE